MGTVVPTEDEVMIDVGLGISIGRVYGICSREAVDVTRDQVRIKSKVCKVHVTKEKLLEAEN